MTGQYDLLVVGDDPAGLCTAACAARAGARTALLTLADDQRKKLVPAIDGVPNFVWRRLDLHQYKLTMTPVSAVVTLLGNGKSVRAYESATKTKTALEEAGLRDHEVWSDFVRENGALSTYADALTTRLAGGMLADGEEALSRFLGGAGEIAMLDRLTDSCAALLDDYFDDDGVKTHIAALAMNKAGLGGGEPGSAMSLSGMFEPSSWPVRAQGDETSLRVVLEKACVGAGVTMFAGAIVSIRAAGAKYRAVELSNGEKIKTRFVFCPSPGAALAAGVTALHAPSPIKAAGAASAAIRIKLSKKVTLPAGDDGAIFQVVDSLDEMQTARDAVVEGRLPDRLPFTFELIGEREILVHTAYCPDSFFEEGEPREWTGQDRQALGRRVVERLCEHIDGFLEAVTRTDIFIEGARAIDEPEGVTTDDEQVVVQPASMNSIAAAVKLADRLLDGA